MLVFAIMMSTTLGNAPSGLLADFQKSPATGVRAEPRFSWVVPPCGTKISDAQTAYQVRVGSNNILYNRRIIYIISPCCTKPLATFVSTASCFHRLLFFGLYLRTLALPGLIISPFSFIFSHNFPFCSFRLSLFTFIEQLAVFSGHKQVWDSGT